MKLFIITVLFASSFAFADDTLQKDALIPDSDFSDQLVRVTNSSVPKAFTCKLSENGRTQKCWLAAGVWQTHELGTSEHMHEFYALNTNQALEIYKALQVPEKIVSSSASGETTVIKLLQVGAVQSDVTLLGCIKRATDQQIISVMCTFYSDVVLESIQ